MSEMRGDEGVWDDEKPRVATRAFVVAGVFVLSMGARHSNRTQVNG